MLPDSAIAWSDSATLPPLNESTPHLPMMFFSDVVAVPQMKSTDTAPWLFHSPVGISRRAAVAVLVTDVILTYSAVGSSTDSRVAISVTDGLVPAGTNVNVEP